MNIISQNLNIALKNRIKILITPIFYNLIDEMIDNSANAKGGVLWQLR